MGSQHGFYVPAFGASMIAYPQGLMHQVILVSSRTYPGKVVFPNGRIWHLLEEPAEDAAVREFGEETPFEIASRPVLVHVFENPPREPRMMTFAKYGKGTVVPKRLRDLEVPVLCVRDSAYSGVLKGKPPKLEQWLDHEEDDRRVVLSDLVSGPYNPWRHAELWAKGHEYFAQLWLQSLEKQAAGDAGQPALPQFPSAASVRGAPSPTAAATA